MKRFLVVVDIQNDFVDGTLGTKEAELIIPAASEKIRNFDGEIFVTFDTGFKNCFKVIKFKALTKQL